MRSRRQRLRHAPRSRRSSVGNRCSQQLPSEDFPPLTAHARAKSTDIAVAAADDTSRNLSDSPPGRLPQRVVKPLLPKLDSQTSYVCALLKPKPRPQLLRKPRLRQLTFFLLPRACVFRTTLILRPRCISLRAR